MDIPQDVSVDQLNKLYAQAFADEIAEAHDNRQKRSDNALLYAAVGCAVFIIGFTIGEVI
jgi:hypothetical protein